MPFILDRLDKVFEHSEYAGLDPVITQPPSTYVPGRVYGCFFDDDIGIANRDRIGITQMVFEVDYPHQDTTWPYSNKLVEKMATQLSPYELDRVLRRNALDMLGID
jgi:predicted TIM-barrel fold metal-dependent hydrolase